MMNKKQRWIYSMLSMLLCVALLIGTTLAWFSDTIRVSGEVKTGNLKIDLLKYDGTDYESIRGSQNNIFSDGQNNFDWYPGRTEIVYLAVENPETLPVKYQVVIEISGVDEGDTAFEYALFDGLQAGTEVAKRIDASWELGAEAGWAALKSEDGAQSGTVVSGTMPVIDKSILEAQYEREYFALAVHMSGDADNTYEGKSIAVDVAVNAVQKDGYFDDGPYLGTSVMFNQDFELNDAIHCHVPGYRLERVTEGTGEDANTYLLLENTNTTTVLDGHVNMANLTTLSDYVVYEFDFKVETTGSYFRVYDDQEDDKGMGLGTLQKDNVFKFADQSVTLDLNEWYTFSVAVDYYEGIINYYLNGELKATAELPDYYDNGKKFANVRIHRTIYGNYGGGTQAYTDPFKVGFDNFRAYDAMAPLDELGQIQRTITMTDESVFPDYAAEIASLNGYMAVHKRSGVVFVNGEKSLLPTLPVASGNDTLINTAELAAILGVTLPAGTQATMDVEAFFTDVLGKTVVTDDAAISSGMVIAGDSAYVLPTEEEELQSLNNYLFYLLPSDEQILDIYSESVKKNVHPRIQGTEEDFARIRQLYQSQSDADVNRWIKGVLAVADGLLEKDPAVYEKEDGRRLLTVCRKVLDKMYALGMAYQITLDQKYADRGYEELESVCKFFDWNPSHAIDVGEMAAAVAIGYDWLYNALTPEQRQVVEQGVYNNAFYDSMIMYQTCDGYMDSGSFGDSNHNAVISGGLTMAALAMLDVYPAEASRILQHTSNAMVNYQFLYAPDGAWFEGPGYWDYATTYMVKHISSLETALGTDLGIGEAEGMSGAGRYILSVQDDNGAFTYGDSMVANVYVPELFYLANEYDPVLTKVLMEQTDGKMGTGEHLALSLLWYDSSLMNESISDMPLDSVYWGDHTLTMRDSYEVEEAAFVGYHAGPTNIDHSHLDSGSFVFDSDGVRWAVELGQDNYNQAGYWDASDHGERWNIWRMRAEAHSTLVINPTAEQDQDPLSFSPLTKVESKDRGAIVLSDLTDAYNEEATEALRGLFFTDNRRSLVVRDEVTLKKDHSEVYWFMLTDSEVTVESAANGLSHTATLKQDGRTLTIDFITSHAAELSCAVAEPLNSETRFDTVETVKRLALKMSDVSGDITITAKLTPGTVPNPSDVTDYDVDMSTWTIPDGVRPNLPKLDKLVVADEEISVGGYINTSYYLEGTLTGVPEVAATCNDTNIEVEVVKGATLADATTIKLTDKNDPTNWCIYTLLFKELPRPVSFDGKTSIPAISATASITPQLENIAMNVIDGNKVTKWAGNVSGNYITLDLNNVHEISGIAVVAQGSDGRIYDYAVSISEDGVAFTDVWEGESAPVSGDTTQSWAYDQYDFGTNYDARYVRLTINGNNQGTVWTSIGEIVVYRNN